MEEIPLRSPEELGLTQKEWVVILDVMNGHFFTEGMSDKDEILSNIEDGIQLDQIDQKHETHGDVLLTKLETFSPDDWAVVRAVIEGFWELSPDSGFSRIPGSRPRGYQSDPD
jgi:hypothetical protein